MIESAPLFIEYCCQDYVNGIAFKCVVFILLASLFASVLSAFWLGWRCGKKSLFRCNAADILPFLE